jgi:hypothetical protein
MAAMAEITIQAQRIVCMRMGDGFRIVAFRFTEESFEVAKNAVDQGILTIRLSEPDNGEHTRDAVVTRVAIPNRYPVQNFGGPTDVMYIDFIARV